VNDESNLVCGQDPGEVVGPGRVVEVPVASGEAGDQVVCSVGFHRGAAGDRHPALALAHRGGDDDRGAGVAAQAPDLQCVRTREQLDGAVGGGLEPHRPGLWRVWPPGHGQEAVQGTSEEVEILGGQ
jgi:hypothetical protein